MSYHIAIYLQQLLFWSVVPK